MATTVATELAVTAAAEPAATLWLNGSEVDLSGIDDDDADDLLDSLDDPPAPRHSHIRHDDRGPEVATDMLRSMDLTWIDHLDDSQLDTLDTYLDHQPG